MLFERTEEQEMLTDTLTRFVVDVVSRTQRRGARAGKMPAEALEGLRDLGVLGLELPESMGGAGFGTVEWVQAVESLATGDGGLALSLVVHSVAASALASSGEVHAATAKSLAAGEAYATVAWVDGRSKALVVEAKGDELVLNGAKEAVALAEHAHWIVVRANLDGESGLAVVQRTASGLHVEPDTHGLGLRSAGLSTLNFENVSVAKSAWLGTQELAATQLHLDLGMAALSLGLGAASLQEGARYGMDRKQFGKPIAMFQANQFKLADMATENDGARLLVLRAALSKSVQSVDMARVFAK